MAFEVGDEVAYDGPLGQHRGSVAAVQADGAVDVRIDGLPELVRTDEGSLSRWYDAGGLVPSGPAMVTNASGVAEEFVPAPTPDSPILPTPGPGLAPEPIGEPPVFSPAPVATPVWQGEPAVAVPIGTAPPGLASIDPSEA